MQALKIWLWERVFLFPELAKRGFSSRIVMRLLFGGKFGLGNLDQELAELLPKENGFFLEIGGNDGISQSNTKRLELYGNWEGILVEPFKENFERISITRSNRCKSVHAACVPFDYTELEVELEYSDLTTVALSLNPDLSDGKSHAASGEKWIRAGKRAHNFKAPARTVTSILDDLDAPHNIDFFSLDVEGAELSVLDGIDFEKYSFGFILIETRSPASLTSFLEPKGYKFVKPLTAHDYFYRRIT